MITKRIFITLFALFAFVGLNAQNYDFSVANNGKAIYYKVIDTANVKVCSGNINCYFGKVEIPDTVSSNGVRYNVVEIDNYAFALSDSLTEVVLPISVKKIGNFAFQSCTLLTNIMLTDSVKAIGKGAFSQCSSLSTIRIPAYLTSVSQMCFKQCASLNNLYIGNIIEYVDTAAFENCTGLVNLTIDSSVHAIRSNAFKYCGALAELRLPNRIDTIEEYAFFGSGAIRNAYLGQSDSSKLEYIGRNAFGYCTRLISTTVYRQMPPKMYDNTFTGVENKHVLHVPCGRKPYYDTAAYWKDLNTAYKTIVEDCGVGLDDEPDMVSVSLYPNPAKTHFIIEGKNIKNITICNILGKEVFRRNGSLSERHEISTYGFKTGFYLVKVGFDGGKCKTLKLQIQ
ncbi:MAG: leucine-rich repeat protein [Bacteroidales bacterium]|nr:leucine-rich repeat protein [Bacteroidales bacterium]